LLYFLVLPFTLYSQKNLKQIHFYYLT